MNAVRVGIIGCGVMGGLHAAAIRKHPEASLAAVADIRKDMADALAQEYGAEKSYASAEALIADPTIQGVTLALPTTPRTGLALKALAAGKHVLLEKPVAMNCAELREMIAAKGDRIAGCCSSRMRHFPSAQRAAECVATGALGRVRSVHCRCIASRKAPPEKLPPSWRLKQEVNGGGILVNWGCYDLDYLLGILGWKLQPEQVLAKTWPIPAVYQSYVPEGSTADTHVTALILCKGGESITFERAEYATSTPSSTWRIIGDAGSLHLDMGVSPDKRIVLDRANAASVIAPETIWEGEEDKDIMHAGVIHDFIDAVRDGRPCMTSLEQSMTLQQITDAIYLSVEKNAAVSIADV